MSTAEQPPARILIVEDEAVTAMDLAAELRGLGYEVCGTADTVDEAVAAVEREKPRLVLMDIRLGDNGDGVDAARRISSRHDTAVVFLTAHSDEETLARALGVSPYGYIVKPFRARELKVAVALALSKHAAERAATAPSAVSSVPQISYPRPRNSAAKSIAVTASSSTMRMRGCDGALIAPR